MDYILGLFTNSRGFLPYGAAIYWDHGVIITRVVSDLIICISYFVIPSLIYLFIYKREHVAFNGLAKIFAGFVISIGLLQLLDIIMIWHPMWRIDAYVRAFAAAAAVSGLITLLYLLPIYFKQYKLKLRASKIEQIEALVSELDETKLQLSYFFDLCPSMLAIACRDTGKFIKVNPAWSKILGWTTEELTSKTWIEFVHPDDIDATLDESLRMGTISKRSIGFINRYKCKNGKYKSIRWISSQYHNGRSYCVAEDVSEWGINDGF